MDAVDVLVVGAGPAGSTVARLLAERGHRVRMVEEHARIGHPVQCAGLVSSRVLELAGTRDVVRRAVHGATVFSPALHPLTFRAAEPRAFVIDRAGLDVHLADRAARAGATVEAGVKFEGVESVGPDGVDVRVVGPTGERRVRARVVVGADGVASGVARAFRLRRPVEILPAFEAEFPVSPGDPDLVEVYLGRAIAPGLFGWWIPDGSGGARVGVAVTPGPNSARFYFDQLVDHLARRFGERLRNPTGYLVSGIPVGDVPRTSGERVVLVGDAAAQVKPLSGGGIFTGMRAGELAGQVLDGALRRNDLSASRLAEYDRLWRAELGDEFHRAGQLRRVFLSLSDADLERVVSALQASDLRASIVAFGDIDFPTHLARRLLRQSPSLFRLAPKALGALAGSGGDRVPDLDPGPRRTA